MNRRFPVLFYLLSLWSFCSCAQQQPRQFSYNDDRLRYEGRIAYTPDAAVLSWPGTSVYIHFTGSSISGTFSESDTANYYNVIVDGKIISIAHFDRDKKTYLLADGLTASEHTLQLFKRTEWDKGKTMLYGFSGAGLELLPPLPAPGRRIEFYGNSITCGYSVEDYTDDSSIGFFENNYDTYAALTDRHFNAQYQCIAKSGIGITISWFPLLMKEMYDRLDATDSTIKWDFGKYRPDIIVINLLQNDYWLTNMPDHAQFKLRFGKQKPTKEFIIEAYRQFVQSIREKYPAAKIICMLGNMNITEEGSEWPGYVKEAVRQLNDPAMYTLLVPYKKTGGHPKTKEQKILADALIEFIGANTGW